MSTEFEQAVDYIYNIPRFTSKNNPEATGAFLRVVGDVSREIVTVHVAGTNGKGSVCAFLRDGLKNCGYSVGLFTSPHLVSITERFTVNDEEITEKEFLKCFYRVKELLNEFNRQPGYENYHPSFFEYLFFMGMLWFGEKKPDVLVLETGLGGRLDATNSISKPAVCVITEIGLDHMEYLGNTVELIAGEKAGIIKSGVPVVYCDRGESVNEVFVSRAERLGSKAVKVGMENIKNFETTNAGLEFSLCSLYDKSVNFSLHTKALYQAENASLAYTAAELLKQTKLPNLDLSRVRDGFSNMRWPGRMEEVAPGLIVDGAHNEDGIRAFLESVAKDGAAERVLIYSAVSDKQIEEVAKQIVHSGLFSKIYVTVIDSYRAADRNRLLSAFNLSDSIDTVFCNSIADSLKLSKSEVSSDCLRYVAGSLYLVGEVKEYIAGDR